MSIGALTLSEYALTVRLSQAEVDAIDKYTAKLLALPAAERPFRRISRNNVIRYLCQKALQQEGMSSVALVDDDD